MDKINNQLHHSIPILRHSCVGRNLIIRKTVFERIPAIVRMTVLWGLVMMIASCSGPSHNDHGPLTQIEKHSNDNIEYTVSSDPYTYDIEKVAVTNSENDTLFFTPNRVNHLVSFPCNNCHTQALGKMISDDPSGKKAH